MQLFYLCEKAFSTEDFDISYFSLLYDIIYTKEVLRVGLPVVHLYPYIPHFKKPRLFRQARKLVGVPWLCWFKTGWKNLISARYHLYLLICSES